MNSIVLIVAFMAVFAQAAERQSSGEPAKLTEAIIAKYGETPCLNKVIGQRLPHPTDAHKFLRCMSLESLWIETCPDGLFYNPSMQICDWSTKPRPTTPTNEVVKNRPVLFRTKFVDGQAVNEIEQQQVPIAKSPLGQSSRDREEAVTQESVTVAASAVTPSLLDELRRKLSMDSSSNEVVHSSTRRALKLLEVPREQVVADEERTTVLPKLRLIEVDREGNKRPITARQEETEESVTPQSREEDSRRDSVDFSVQEERPRATSRRSFLRSGEKTSTQKSLNF